MKSIAELPVSRLLRAINDFDMPRQVRYSNVNPRLVNVAKSLDSLMSVFLNISVSLSLGVDSVAFSFYASFVLAVLFCVFIAYFTWYIAISAVIAVTVIFFAATVLKSRRFRRMAAQYSGFNESKISPVSISETLTKNDEGNKHLEICRPDTSNIEVVNNQPREKLSIRGNDVNTIDIFISDDKEGIIYSDGDYHSKGQPTDDKPTNEVGDSIVINSIEIVDNYSSETILGNGSIGLRSDPKEVDSRTSASASDVLSEIRNDRSIEIVNSSSVEAILSTVDGRSIVLRTNKVKLSPIVRPSGVEAKRHSVEILNSSGAETIYYSETQDLSDSTVRKKIKPKFQRSERAREERRLVEIMMDTSIEQIITSSDVRSAPAVASDLSTHRPSLVTVEGDGVESISAKDAAAVEGLNDQKLSHIPEDNDEKGDVIDDTLFGTGEDDICIGFDLVPDDEQSNIMDINSPSGGALDSLVQPPDASELDEIHMTVTEGNKTSEDVIIEETYNKLPDLNDVLISSPTASVLHANLMSIRP